MPEVSYAQCSRIENAHTIVLALPDFAYTRQSRSQFRELFNESSGDRVLIAVRSDEGASHCAAREESHRNAMFVCLFHERIPHCCFLLALHEFFLDNNRAWGKVIH